MVTKISAFSLEWIEEKKKEIKYSTYCAYQTILGNYVDVFFDDVKDISQENVVAFRESLEAKKLSSKSIKDILVVLRMLVKFLIRKRILTSDSLMWEISLKNSRDEIEILSKTSFKKLHTFLLANFSFSNLGILIVMNTGLRIGEICALKWEDIDLVDSKILVSKTLQRVYDRKEKTSKIIIDTPKTISSKREIPISNEIVRLVKPLKRVVNNSFFVISNSISPIEPRTYREIFKKILLKNELPVVKFHSLRHTFATRCVEANSNYKTISSILGHSNVVTTMNLYVHPNNEEKKQCIERMLKKTLGL